MNPQRSEVTLLDLNRAALLTPPDSLGGCPRLRSMQAGAANSTGSVILERGDEETVRL